MCSANGCPASTDAQNLETETREELNYAFWPTATAHDESAKEDRNA